jgi:hypothetical protein
MRSFIFVTAVALAGCAPTDPNARFRDTFAQEVAGLTAGPARSCISTFGDQNLRVVNPQMVAYGQGRTVNINRLRAPCPALEPGNTIIIETQGSQYCSGDKVRGLEPGAIIPGPVCLLGEWTPYKKS